MLELQNVTTFLGDNGIFLFCLLLEYLGAAFQFLQQLVELFELELVRFYFFLLHVHLRQLFLQLIDDAIFFVEVYLEGGYFRPVVFHFFVEIVYLDLFAVDLLHKQVLVLLVLLYLGAQFRTDGLHLVTATALLLPVKL